MCRENAWNSVVTESSPINKKNIVYCIAADVTSNDGAKPEQENNPAECAAAMVTVKGGAKPQREYSPG